MENNMAIIEEVHRNVFEHPKQFMDLDYLLSLESKLKELSDEASSRLKRNVYENYSLFIESSKEISNLNNEMRTLENLLEQQQDFLNKLLNKLNEGISLQQDFDQSKLGRPTFELINSDIPDEMLEEIEPSWLKKVPEELDIIIAQHEFEEGVKLTKIVRQHLKDYPSVKADLRYKIDSKLEELVGSICTELQISSKSAIVSIKLLNDLNLCSKAIKIYLNKRSSYLRERSVLKKDVKLEQNFIAIEKMINIFFDLLKETWNEFVSALDLEKEIHLNMGENLPSPQYSVIYYWISLETENLCQHLKSANLPSNLLKEAKQIIRNKSAEFAKETGLSLLEFVAKSLK